MFDQIELRGPGLSHCTNPGIPFSLHYYDNDTTTTVEFTDCMSLWWGGLGQHHNNWKTSDNNSKTSNKIGKYFIDTFVSN